MAALLMGLVVCCTQSPDPDPEEGDAGPGGSPDAGTEQVLSVFFGLDNALPMSAVGLCLEAPGRDGMPVTFSKRIAASTLTPEAFQVRTASGVVATPRCATLAPANEASERHTVLLIGEFGNDPADPPVTLDIVRELPFEGGGSALGLSAGVTPLAAGPTLLLALEYTPATLPSDCPSQTRSIVQVTWAGGVSPPGGGALGDAQRLRHHVTLREADGALRETVPAALADLGDNDNYLHLCLTEALPATRVRVEADTVVDPRGDPNPETLIDVEAGG